MWPPAGDHTGSPLLSVFQIIFFCVLLCLNENFFCLSEILCRQSFKAICDGVEKLKVHDLIRFHKNTSFRYIMNTIYVHLPHCNTKRI